MTSTNLPGDGDITRRRWRKIGRRCTVVTFQSHKGGQGRTLTCAHSALDLAKRHIEQDPLGRRAAPKILLVDLDWEAPGLSYMFSKDALPPEYAIENEQEYQQQGPWSSVELLTAIADAIKDDRDLRKLISANDGIPENDKDHTKILDALRRQVLDGSDAGSQHIALQVLTPPIAKDGSEPVRGRIYLLPAKPISEIRAAYSAMQFDVGVFIQGFEGEPTVTGDALLRIFVLFLIRQFDLDYLLIDSRAGMTPLGYMTSSRLSDITLIPTTTYNQALDGAKALMELLYLPSLTGGKSGPPYGPERVLSFYSNVSEDKWKTDTKGNWHLSKDIEERVSRRLGKDARFLLPHVRKLAHSEGFVTPSSMNPQDESEVLYVQGIQELGDQIEQVFNAKVEGQFAAAPSEALFSPHALDSLLALQGSLTIKMLVEEGGFGEEPFIKLLNSPVAEPLRNRLIIKPIPVAHDNLLKFVRNATEESRDLKHMPEVGEPLDLISFPHYLLGKFAQERWILPLTFLDKPELAPSLDFGYLHDHFYLADELCLHAGTPFAFPFSVLRKLLLIKKGFERKFGSNYEKKFGESLDVERAGWRVVQRSLEIAKSEQGKSPLILENRFDLVGVWYDWLEFVFAFGGRDFSRRSDRGSDYGECRLNNVATIDGTFAYLNLFWQSVARRSDVGYSWDTIIPEFHNDPFAWMTVAWSDIVTSEWDKRLKTDCVCIPFPSAQPTPQEPIVEGWVMGIPFNLKGETERLKAIKSFLSWFMSEPVQAEFARVGGSPSRKLPDEDLPDILRLVHSALTPPKGELNLGPNVAPKITFPEAPNVIGMICETLREMVGWQKPYRKKERVAIRMEKLAKDVALETLYGKSAYVPTSQLGP